MKKFILVCVCLLSLVKFGYCEDNVPQQLEEIYINNFVYASDLEQFGVNEYYQDPTEFETTFRGDCEDIAIHSYVYLKASNYESYMYTLVFLDGGHAITVFKQFGYYHIFSNGLIYYTNKTKPIEAVMIIYPEYVFIMRFIPTKFGHIQDFDKFFSTKIIKINILNLIK